jgi:glycine oxidase
VVLVERAAGLGTESSAAAAGMLSPQMEAAEEILVAGEAGAGARRDAMLELCLAGRERVPALVRELEAETGCPTHYREDGTLVVALDEEEAGRLAARGAEQRARGLRARWLEPAAARALEPGITPRAAGALHLPDDHQIDNVALLVAVEASVRSLPGIEVRTATRVAGLAIENGRVAGVRTEGGTLPAGAVVLAAGAWSSAVVGLPGRVEVRPVKGQMAALRPAAPPFARIVGGRSVYCVPRDDGRIIVGATVEEAGFDKGVDPRAVERLLAAAADVVPALAAAPLHASWAGLRPGTADDLPVLGPDPEVEGLLWATGHYRNGILLAPLTAETIAALLRGAPPPVDLRAFAPDRPVEALEP